MAKLKLKDIVTVTGGLPRLVEMLDGKEGRIFPFVRVFPRDFLDDCEIVVIDGGVGKQVGIQLPDAPSGFRWYDAHECDGACPKGSGWWITPDQIVVK